MGCGQKAWAIREEEEAEEEYRKRCVKAVKGYKQRELGHLLYTLKGYFEDIKASEQRTFKEFKVIDNYLSRLPKD